MIKVHDVKQGTEEWHKLRENLFTGSSAHLLLKHNTRDYPKAKSNFKGNFYTRRGHALEEEAIDLYKEIRNTPVDRFGFVTNTKYPDCGYSPDGSTNDRVVEVKAFGKQRHLDVYKSVPIEILAQCHFGMMIMEKKLCDLLLYNPEIEAENCLLILTIKHDSKITNNFKRILYG